MKVLHADLAEDSLFVKRFQREAEALQSLAHPHIVPFYGLYQAEDFAFLLEAYIDGLTLKEMIEKRRGQPFSLQEALTVLKSVCAALGYAHVNQVIHRDVKPANIMLDKGGNVPHGFRDRPKPVDDDVADLRRHPRLHGPRANPRREALAGHGCLRRRRHALRDTHRQAPLPGQRAGHGDRRRIDHAAHLLRPPARPHPRPVQPQPSLPPSLRGVMVKALEKEPDRRFAGTQEFFNTCLEALDLTPGEVPDRWQEFARSCRGPVGFDNSGTCPGTAKLNLRLTNSQSPRYTCLPRWISHLPLSLQPGAAPRRTQTQLALALSAAGAGRSGWLRYRRLQHLPTLDAASEGSGNPGHRPGRAARGVAALGDGCCGDDREHAHRNTPQDHAHRHASKSSTRASSRWKNRGQKLSRAESSLLSRSPRPDQRTHANLRRSITRSRAAPTRGCIRAIGHT